MSGIPTRAAWALVVLFAMLVAGPAHAHLDWAKESGIVRLDSATAVANGATALSWRTASPLAVPDRFGPGAVLSVGAIRMKVVNTGVLGNPYTNTSSDPAAQWPGLSGVEYLNAISLAVGAQNPFATDPNGRERVSNFGEWRPPTLDPVDRIYESYDGIENGQRFVNDDGDVDYSTPDTLQKIDEDFQDGRDNDGDGLIDEDYAALGQQMFSYVIRDDTKEAINTLFNEKHVPLGIEVKVRVWAYAIDDYPFNVCEYDIRNVSGHELDNVYVGWLVDMDAGPTSQSPYWTDDLDFPQYPSGTYTIRVGDKPGDLPDPARKQGGDALQKHAGLPELPQRYFPAESALCPRVNLGIHAFSLADNDGDDGRTTGIGTFMLIDHSITLGGGAGPRRVGFHSFRSSSAFAPYSQGGLPRTDAERYESMASGENVAHSGLVSSLGQIVAPAATVPGDYVEWCSIGPWSRLDPGQVITATIAFGVQPGTADLARQYPADYARYTAGLMSSSYMLGKYPSLANALTAQIAFEGIHEYRQGYLETRPINKGGRDFHGRETPMKLPPGSEPQIVIENCGPIIGEREVLVTDQEYSWFNFDCDFCTGVWAYDNNAFPLHTGLFHKTWNAQAPPPNPNLNVAAKYNFSDNPGRRVVAAGDRAVNLAWDDVPVTTPDPLTHWFDFRGFDVWKAADWTREAGSAGPTESDWLLLGEFRIFDYYRGALTTDPPLEHNYARNATTGDKICPQRFFPNYYDPDTKLYGKTLPVCLDRFDVWDKESGVVLKPDWTVPCEYDTSADSIRFEIDTGDLEWNAPSLVGGSWTHEFRDAGSYPYVCVRHLAHKGAVVVSAGGADSATVQVLDTGFAPPSVTIHPGGRVRWVNVGAANHALQTDRHCQTTTGVILHRSIPRGTTSNQETRPRFPIGRYVYVDHEVLNGFVYFYSVTAFDSVTTSSITTQLGGRRTAVEADAVVPEARTDANGKRGVWVVPNPYRGYQFIQDRPSGWDLHPNASDPTGTHIDFMGMPRGRWTLKIWTLAGDLVDEIHSTDAVNESTRRPVVSGNTTVPGFNRQQDNPDDGEAQWNLISRSGQDVVSGIYLFTVDSSEGTQRGKFVIIR